MISKALSNKDLEITDLKETVKNLFDKALNRMNSLLCKEVLSI